MRLCRWLFIFLMFIPVVSYSNTFDTYVNKHCIKGCVSSSNILKSSMEVASSMDLDFKMLLAIAKVESGYRVRAKNGSNVGLMQTHLRWHRSKFSSKNYYDVKDNIKVGAIVYRDCLKKHKGNIRKALRCYNGGGDKLYVSKVMKAYKDIITIQAFKDMDKDPLGGFLTAMNFV